jgi:hypothetical protein
MLASIAPGMTSTNRLSTTSMIVIETVSAASAVETTTPAARPALTRGMAVRLNPNR